MSKCIGCGIKLQTTDCSLDNYVPEIALIEKGEKVYCKRCHDIMHHNLKYHAANNLDDYYQKIKIIKHEKALVLLLIDVMDLLGGFINNLKECIGDNKVLVIVNKVDLLPKDFKINFFQNHLKKIAQDNDLQIVDIMFGSVKRVSFVKKIVNKINELKYFTTRQKTHITKECLFGNCYVVGYASVGKSTLMNQIGKIYLDYQSDVITTSTQFNTTRDFIKWPLDQKSFIIDTPGIINPYNFGAYLTNQSTSLIMPKSYLKPRTFQLNDDQTIYLGALMRIDFMNTKKISASFYVANDLYIHRTKTINANELYKMQVTKLLKPPFTLDEVSSIKDYQEITFIIDGTYDMFICGLGFIHLVSEYAEVKVYISNKIKVGVLKNV